MRKVLYILGLIFFLFSCEKGNMFIIEGNIKNAQGNILYLEHVDISKANLIDSVKLNAQGNFKFKRERPVSPEFYRLILNKQFIDLAVDSTETIKIYADLEMFPKDYSIEGSENSIKIKELSILRDNVTLEFNKLSKSFGAKEISREEYADQASKVIDTYKETARKYIIEGFGSTAAYYALLQTVNGLTIFDPYDKEDSRLYGAVATQWDFHYPNNQFSQYIKNLSLQGMVALRTERPVKYTMGNTISFFDIDLPTISGAELKLSQIAQGKVTLLEFCSYVANGSPEHNMLLAKIYDKYKDKGFQIFQVSIDPDEHAWKNAAVNLPWICVRDPQSIYSENLKNYNVENIPTGFILNKNGELVLRIDSYKNIESDINKYFK
ncbi:MAG: AhpC/TSA family protein [Candidatus Azobacteroides sp.]|nr:AhpC/TSA family protein [Candidatus Azobacteroides sp.]